jgi:hypothetical protein
MYRLSSFFSSLPPEISMSDLEKYSLKLHNGFGFVIQFRVGIRYVICQGASFEKKEFKRNLAGSVSYPPVYGM